MISAEVQEKFVSDNKMRRFFVNPESRSRLHDTQTFRGVNGRSNEEGRAEKRPHLLTHCFSLAPLKLNIWLRLLWGITGSTYSFQRIWIILVQASMTK